MLSNRKKPSILVLFATFSFLTANDVIMTYAKLRANRVEVLRSYHFLVCLFFLNLADQAHLAFPILTLIYFMLFWDF